jgi:hypothetical protein
VKTIEYLGKTKREYLKEKITDLETNNKNKHLRFVQRRK